MTARPPIGLVLAVAALVGIGAAAGSVGEPAGTRAASQQVEVQGATAVCPDVRQFGGDLYKTRVSIGAAPLPAGRAAAGGAVDIATVSGPGAPGRVPITQPGQVALGLGTSVKENGLAISATGALAAGLEVEQVVRSNGGHYRGLANIRCEPPNRDSWFVGASTGIADYSSMVLANVDDTPAIVDITAFGRTGAVDPRPGRGLTVAPHSRLLFQLDTLVPDMLWTAVHVTCRQGRVVAAMKNARQLDKIPRGFDYVPQAAPPATQVVVPGIPAGPGFRGLIVGNPTGDDTTVKVQVTLKDGQFVPQGMEELRVPAYHTSSVNLTSLTDGSPLTATITSEGPPILAGAVLYEAQQYQVGHIAELAYAGSSLPLSGPALLTDLVIDRPTESTLLLTAPESDAVVSITPIRVLGQTAGPPAARRVRVPGGRTVAFRLSTFFPPGTQARLAVEVRADEGSGPLYATRYLRERGSRGTLAALLVLRGPAQLVSRPATVQDDEAGYP